jgi:hypothetical protein
MAKKYKRSTSAATSTRTTEAAAGVAGTEKTTAGLTARRTGTGEFNPDYTYVVKDLKRIGTLAGSFFVILVVLSFFLNR